MTTVRKLERSAEDRLICGISGGIAERFDLDPVAVRMGWLVACFLTAGGAALVYMGLCFLIPLGTSARPVTMVSDPKKGANRLANLREEARVLLEVRRELGPEYEDEQIDSFIEKIDTRLQPRRRLASVNELEGSPTRCSGWRFSSSASCSSR